MFNRHQFVGRSLSIDADSPSVNLNVALTFSEPVRHGSFVLKDSASNVVSSGVSYNPQAQTITLTPGAELLGSRHYTATVSGASKRSEGRG